MSLPLNYLAGKAIQPLPRLPDCNPVTLINYAFLAHGFGPNIVQEAPDTHTILSLVGAGAGIGFVPITADHIKLPGVVLIPVRTSQTSRWRWPGASTTATPRCMR